MRRWWNEGSGVSTTTVLWIALFVMALAAMWLMTHQPHTLCTCPDLMRTS